MDDKLILSGFERVFGAISMLLAVEQPLEVFRTKVCQSINENRICDAVFVNCQDMVSYFAHFKNLYHAREASICYM